MTSNCRVSQAGETATLPSYMKPCQDRPVDNGTHPGTKYLQVGRHGRWHQNKIQDRLGLALPDHSRFTKRVPLRAAI